MSKNQSSKTTEDLQKASEAFYYEIMMLNSCASAISKCPESIILSSQFTQNILIESFCVHLRNLIEFFDKKKDDRYRITHEYFLPENINVTYPHNLKKKYSKKSIIYSLILLFIDFHILLIKKIGI